jgi:hypothetical protein
MNNNDIHNIIDCYENDFYKDETVLFDEKVLLSTIKSSIEWNEKSDEEKCQHHKVVLSVAKKTGNFQVFDFEILMIEIYELMLSILKLIENHLEDRTLFRLSAIIKICIYYKNEFRDLSRVNIFPFKVLSQFIHQNGNSDEFMKIGSDVKELAKKIDMALNFRQS